MKFRDRIRTASKAFFSSELGNSTDGSVSRNFFSGSEFSPNRQLKGITYKAIDKIGMALSVYEPLVEKANGDTLENHPLYVLSRQPSPRVNSSDFNHLVGMLYEIYGETFWYLARGELTGKTKEIHLLNPAQMELKVNDGELIGYVLHKDNGEQVPFELEEIIHDKRPNPFNNWRGMSVMERASQYIDIELVTTTFTLNYMRNNASPSGIVSLPNMTPEAFQKFSMQWREGYEGPHNAGKTAFIRGGEADFKAVGATLKDVDQKITRDMAKDDVLMMFDMPKGLLGGSGDKGLGRSETEALEYIFAKYKVEPMMTRLDKIYEQILKTFPANAQQGTISHLSPIPEDKQFILSMNEKGVDKWVTRNEARQAQGLPPLPGGDELVPAPVKQPDSTQTKTSKRVVLKKKASKSDMTKALNQEQEDFRKNLVDTNEIYSKKFKATLSNFAANQQDKIISNINASAKSFEEWLFSIKDESEALAGLLTPVVIDLMEAQSEDVANFVSGELLTISPEIRRDVEANILKISGVYNEDTIKALEKTLTEGQTQGESLVKLKKRVESVYGDAKGYRAERIARTETLKASNNTAELVYKQNGFSKVQWFINPGACEFCQSYSGRTKTIGSSYTKLGDVVTGTDGGQMSIDYADVDVPPLHPNCSCSIIPI
jgi:HK97 family phage portal protein